MNVRELPTEREIIERLKCDLTRSLIDAADLRGNLALAQREAAKWKTLHNEKCKEVSEATKAKNKKLRAYKAYVLVLTGSESLPKTMK